MSGLIARASALLHRAGIAPTAGSALRLRRSETRLRLDWIVAAMTFLATLALLGALAVGEQAATWRTGLRGSLTVEIPAAAEDAQRRDRVLAVVRAEPAVARAEPISRVSVAELLAPWLGAAGLSNALPVPQLIDVNLIPGARLDVASLNERIAAAAPGASIDDHGRWLGQLLRLATLATLAAIGIVIVVLASALVAVTLSTRAGLALQHQAVALLHLIGAEDRYIAREFARDALIIGLRGGVTGFVAALVSVLAFLAATGPALEPAFLPRPVLGPGALALLALMPLAAAALCAVTAWVTVMLDLRRRI